MTRQLRHVPAEKRGRAVLGAIHAVWTSGTRYARVTYDDNYAGPTTRRFEILGYGMNTARTSSGPALVCRETDTLGRLLDLIPETRLMSIVADPDPVEVTP